MKEHQGTKALKLDLADPDQHKSRDPDIGKFFDSIPGWAVFALIVFSYILVSGAGAWIGYTWVQSGDRIPESPIGTAVGAAFGLLAFMLGFTFSLTWSRYASRSGLVILQAKALGFCYLRTSLIPEKQKGEIRTLLHEYIHLLLGLQTATDLEKEIARIDELHLLIWQQTASLIQEDMDPEIRVLFISSVNELISLSVERKTIALVFRIPGPIWASLLFLAGIGMFAFGYQTGVNGLRRIFEMTLLPVAFGLVIVLIADLNSFRSRGRFKVSQQPLKYVLEMMEKDVS